MENITLKDILYVLSAITVIITFIVKAWKPYQDLRDQIDKQQQTITDLSNSIKAQQRLLNSSLKVQMLLMEHTVYGNHTDMLKAELTKLQSIIVDVNN